MQVSSSIQALGSGGLENSPGVENSGEIIHANVEDSSVWGSRNSKKAKPGLFARLLDGLTGKTGKAAIRNSGNGFSNDLINNVQDTENSALGVSGRNAKLSGLSKKTLSGGIDMGVSDLFGDQEGKNTANSWMALQEDFLFSEENLLAKEMPDDQASQRIIARRSGAELSGGQSDQLAETERQILSARQDMFSLDQNAGYLSENKTASRQHDGKPGKAAVDLLGSRNQENRFADYSGAPKPGLVDVLALEREQAREGGRRTENRGKRAEKVSFEVRDLRTGETRPNNPIEASHSANSADFRTEKVDVEIPVDLSAKSGTAGEKAQDGSFPRPGAFEDALARELRENLNTDIVRQASIILRNGGEATIRLTIKPETLGNVKIRLEMAENKITGHIIVENSEALRAFERELPVLEKAFQESGFSETNLEMFLAQDNGNYESRRQNEEFPQFTPELAVSRYESETEIREIPKELISDMSGRTSVNMLI
jgi:flagellar hook-length control protein FliK